jgi:type VI secretion system protein ImpA
MSATIDIDALAAPLDGDSPAGVDLREDVRFDSPYQALKSLREEAMGMERAMQQGGGADGADHATARSNWQEVVRAAQEILAEQSKDLEICALLVEALIRTDGIAGVRDGFILADRLVESMWDDLHPRIDPDDPDSLEDRLAAFNGLDGGAQPGTLARFFLQLPVTASNGLDDFLAYQLEQASNQRESGDDNGDSGLGFTMADIRQAADKTPLAFYQEISRELEEVESARIALDKRFTDLCGFDAPSMGRTREAIEKLQGHVRFLAGERLDAAAAEAEAGEAPEGGASADAGAEPGAASGGRAGVAAPAGAIQNREDAISRLRKIAEWFRKNEPHSPLSYSLENLARWAGMPLDQLISEWIEDDSALERYRLMTGMNVRDDD